MKRSTQLKRTPFKIKPKDKTMQPIRPR
ncbi:MAG: hypothetical protein RIS45_197, partial [Planctomycetota bacterium]